jgi:D-lactate dehydrogenase
MKLKAASGVFLLTRVADCVTIPRRTEIEIISTQERTEAQVMKCLVFSAKPYDRKFLKPLAEENGPQLDFIEARISERTSRLAEGFPAICTFVNDPLTAEILEQLHTYGTQLITLRCAGYNQVHLTKAQELGFKVTRVPAYSPYAVAEHAVGMTLSLCRHLHRAYQRVRDNNFALDGLLGFDLHGRDVGIVGTGAIGSVTAKIFAGFGCNVKLFDIQPNPACKGYGEYVPLDHLLRNSDIVSLHCPLTPETFHMINTDAVATMRKGVMLINTSRGGLVDTQAVIQGLKTGHIGSVGLDVYEEEGDLFFEDLSNRVITDDVFSRLLTFPNVLITAHQAFFTTDALKAIAETTIANLDRFEKGEPLLNSLT